tara:strand:- start:148 stop:1098 length:951 start_codon:yes stop_codon:yes gene_type:complete
MGDKLKCLVVGCTPLAEKVSKILFNKGCLVGVVNLHPSLGAKKSNYTIVDFAEKNIPSYFTKDINDQETHSWISNKKPDVVFQCGWSQIFKKHILDIPSKFCLGFHPSPLPMGRGAAVLNWKIIESEGQDVAWGNSLFVMEEKTDTGAVIDFEPLTIEKRDDIRTAYLKVDNTSCKMVARSLGKILKNKIHSIQQNHREATRYYKRSPEDGMMNMNWSATKINDYVRALTHPYPGAFFETKIGKIFVWESIVLKSNKTQKPGTIINIDKNGVELSTGSQSSIQIKRISYGKQEFWADSIFQELGLKAGDSLLNDME